MRITCPHCGERGNEEFAYLGDATVRRPDDAGAARPGAPEFERWMDYVYLRDNPAGRHRELWQHVHGCRAWLVVTRDISTHAIFSVEDARAAALARPSLVARDAAS
ncbi:sarcosine oxidase subunit delta [Alsobacter sp. SYSU M60028]|uniref:Sarcosine oxidase subunit delta n=1 Tax=Alsobacter ponti TaxID=2962936 RepID=A0ABT1L856_9HYPH|nr:sarcosine oxidase subunit delta [Alsobacter ponti]MCP8937675.1 sarcosine oxidase subunit delta [Alsobacter ponti]